MPLPYLITKKKTVYLTTTYGVDTTIITYMKTHSPECIQYVNCEHAIPSHIFQRVVKVHMQAENSYVTI